MVALPELTPDTIPVAEPTVATDVLPLLHVPPLTALPSVELPPMHTLDVPVIVPADGAPFTVTTAVAVAVPHPIVTV